MAIPEIIEQLAHKVRTEIYGRDVREALATSMEVTAEVAEWSREVAQQIIDGTFDEGALNTEIERKLNELEQQYAPKLTSLETEIDDARGNEGSLSERFNTINTQIELTEKIATSNRMYPVTTPELFEWKDHPLRNKIFTDGYGNYHIRDFKIERYKPRGKIYYVDIINGDDSNDGLTINTPLRSIRTAYEKGDSTVIKIAEGVYERSESLWGVSIDRDLTIEALEGHNVLISNIGRVNWQPDTRSNVYRFSTTNVQFILDATVRDDKGDYYKYKQVNTADEVESEQGTYAIEDGVLYLHTVDSRVPDNDTVWRFADGDAISIAGNCTVYLEGIKQWGGNRPLLAENVSGEGDLRVFAKNCDFRYSRGSQYDVVHIKGAKLAIFENCSATDGQKDGFNYYPHNGKVTNAIEINCVGKRNGTEGRGSDQGSTQHAGGKAIRINGTYSENNGSNIADDGVGTQSWNLGCIGFESKSGTTSQKANFFAYPDVDVFLDGCLGYDVGQDGYDIGGRGNVYVRNNNLLSDNKIADTVNLVEY